MFTRDVYSRCVSCWLCLRFLHDLQLKLVSRWLRVWRSGEVSLAKESHGFLSQGALTFRLWVIAYTSTPKSLQCDGCALCSHGFGLLDERAFFLDTR